MPVKGVRCCGAKCRTKGGAPCLGPSMKNGRCRMHGGTKSRLAKHGRETVNAHAQRKHEKKLMREINNLNNEINSIVGQK